MSLPARGRWVPASDKDYAGDPTWKQEGQEEEKQALKMGQQMCGKMVASCCKLRYKKASHCSLHVPEQHQRSHYYT